MHLLAELSPIEIDVARSCFSCACSYRNPLWVRFQARVAGHSCRKFNIRSCHSPLIDIEPQNRGLPGQREKLPQDGGHFVCSSPQLLLVSTRG